MTTRDKSPYIGVTGFTTKEQVGKARSNFSMDSLIYGEYRLLMVGVVATYKSLRGIPMKPKWAQQTVPPTYIADLFFRDRDDWPDLLNLIHFSTEKESSPKETLHDMLHLMSLGGENCHGLQLNMDWPLISLLENFKKANQRQPRIVLQVSSQAIEMIGDEPKQLVKAIAPYIGLIDDVLLDPSGGNGKPFNPSKAEEYLTELYMYSWDIGLGVAGGLGPDSLDLIDGLVEKFPKLNIDAQGRLRNENNELDLGRVNKYTSTALKMFDGDN